MSNELIDYYEVLQCNRNAGIEAIKKNYQRLVLSSHPDKIKGENRSKVDFQLIQEAWNTLRDSALRKQYDAKLACDEHNEMLVYDTVSLQNMNYNSEEYCYSYLCRCGGTYVLEKEQCNRESSLILDCDECSFSIKVLL